MGQERGVVADRGMEGVPGLRRFVVSDPIGPTSESVDRFYDVLEGVRRAKNDIKALPKEQLREHVLSNRVNLAINKRAESTAKTMTELSRMSRQVRTSNLDPEQKREILDRIGRAETALASQFLGLYDRAVEKIGGKR